MKKDKTVKLVADPYPPYQFEEQDVIKGIDHDTIAAAFREQELDVSVRLFGWDKCMEMVRSGRAHGIFQIQPTPEREEAFLFSKPLRRARTIFFADDQKRVDLSRFNDLGEILSAHSLGVVKGYSYDPLIDNLPGPDKIHLDSQEALLKGLALGKYDLAVVDLGVGSYLAARLGLKNINPVAGFEVSRVLSVAFQRELTELVDLFNLGLDRLRQQGVVDQIFNRYGVVG